eukprot:3288492-Rhodomonas_salina.1
MPVTSVSPPRSRVMVAGEAHDVYLRSAHVDKEPSRTLLMFPISPLADQSATEMVPGRHSSTSVQEAPSPEYPALHSQEKPPTMSVH